MASAAAAAQTWNVHPDDADDAIRETVARWIIARDIRQEDLAMKIGRNQAWMSRYLKGEFAADMPTLARIAKAFDVHPCLLFGPPQTGDAAIDALISDVLALDDTERLAVSAIVARLARGRRPRHALQPRRLRSSKV